jgi:SH3 domain-containing YSC84-like protein 1
MAGERGPRDPREASESQSQEDIMNGLDPVKAASRRVTRRTVVAGLVGATALAAGLRPAAADDREEALTLIEQSRLTLRSVLNDKGMQPFRQWIKKAKGVFIAPEVIRGAFLVGASGGSGVFVARPQGTEWAGPAFYTIGQASFGFQAGGDVSQLILLAMTDRGVNSLLETTVKLGGDVSVAAGPVGAGVTADTAALSADILSFSRSKGLYGGVSLTGAVVTVRDKLNDAFYGADVNPTDILITRKVSSPAARPLIAAVAAAAK